MYKDFIGCEVNLVISTRTDNLLEYSGKIEKEDENTIVMSNVSISYLMLNFQKNILGNNLGKYREDISEVIINKKYIISCNKQ